MRRIVLIRHGRTGADKQNPDRGVTEKGKYELRESAYRISDFLTTGEVVVLTSPKVRAKQSAQLLAKYLGGIEIIDEPLRVQNADSIKEEIVLGRRQGIGAAQTYLASKNPDVETPLEAANRLKKIILKHRFSDLIIVGHEGFLDAFVQNQSGFRLLYKSFDELFGYGDFAVFEQI